MRNLDDFQQNIYKSETVTKSILECALILLEEGTPETFDKVSNLLIGLTNYIETWTNSSGEWLENRIQADLSGNLNSVLSGKAILKNDGCIYLSSELREALNIGPGAIISWSLNNNGEVICKKTGSIPLSQG